MRQLEHPRVVVGQAAERAAHLVQHPVADDGPDDRFGGLAVQQPVGPVQVRPQVRQHPSDQRPRRHRQPPGQTACSTDECRANRRAVATVSAATGASCARNHADTVGASTSGAS